MTNSEIISVIVAITTSIVTFILGELSKKFGILEKNYIPLQNALVGIFAGIFVYAAGLQENIITSIVICFISAYSAGGIYDVTKMKGGE